LGAVDFGCFNEPALSETVSCGILMGLGSLRPQTHIVAMMINYLTRDRHQKPFQVSQLMSYAISLQDRYAPNLVCFGCGPANPLGLQIKSFPDLETNQVSATFTPQSHHTAFAGIVNGGIIGVLLDCHMNWTAAWHLMQAGGLEKPPCSVTAKYEVEFLRPTPTDQSLELTAWVLSATERKAIIAGTISVAGEITANGTGTFVAVKPGHPAYHRW
jgi:acyl-coenzyme A thioesterase PaaI-like protein